MPWKWCSCFKPEREDIRELDYQHLGLKEVPVNVFVHERTLEELNLEANRITELPRALFHCHGLRVLNLSDNDITVVPPAIASLINLEHLNLSKNSLSDIPDNIKCCKQLVHVNLSVNPLEKLPDGFTQLIALEEVYLNDTFLEFLPANFGRLSKLRVLDLRENNLNTLPKSIARLCNLRVLDIGKNEFSDLPEVIGNLPELTELWADYNRIRCIPQFIGNLTKLTHLDLSNNNVNWIAAEIEKCVNLYYLTLTGNDLQNIPDEIGNLRELYLLKLDDNEITALPSTLGKLSNLNELVVSENLLTALPSNIGLLRKLEFLNADDNRMPALPPELGSCISLRILSIRNNCLESFPAELGHLASIRIINVADNFLDNLPVSILNLHQLTALWLSTNQATPLTTLQQEIDPITGQMICTNFMFPQVEQERNLDELTGAGDTSTEPVEVTRPSRPHIWFADNTELLHPSRLTRAPTPYPKELRSMAKHARILATQPRSLSTVDENIPLLVGTTSPVTIKVATVTKPSTSSLTESAITSAGAPVSQSRGNEVWHGEEEYMQDLCGSETSSNLPDVLGMNNISRVKNVFEPNLQVAAGENVPMMEDTPSLDNNSDEYDAMPLLAANDRVVNGLSTNKTLKEFNAERTTTHSNREDLVQDVKLDMDGYKVKENGKPAMDLYSEGMNKPSMEFDLAVKTPRKDTNLPLIDLKQEGSASASYQGEQLSPNSAKGSGVTFITPPTVTHTTPLDTKQPPPYHIAAAYSKQAAYFNNTSPYTPDVSLCATPSPHSMSYDETLADTVTLPRELQGNEVRTPVFRNYEGIGLVPCVNSSDSRYEIGHMVDKIPGEHESSCEIIEETTLKPLVEQMAVEEKMLHASAEEITSTPVFERKIVEEIIPRSIIEPKTDKEMVSLHCDDEQKATLDPSLCLSLAQKSSEESSSQVQRRASPVKSPTLPEKPVSKIPSFKSKSSPYGNKPPISPHSTTTPQSRMLQPGFYASRQRTNNPGSMPDSTSPSNSGPNSLEQQVIDNKTDSRVDANLNISNNANLCKSPKVLETSGFVSKIPTVKGLRAEMVLPGALDTSFTKTMSPLPSPESPTSPSAWVFGQHKNPTVFPVMIKKNPGLGFTIAGGSSVPGSPEKQESGIFITKVNPSGPAANSLVPGDKILEVDGIDFSKLGHDQAVRILKQTKRVVNMMVSRQK